LPGKARSESATNGPWSNAAATYSVATYIPVSFGDEKGIRQQFAISRNTAMQHIQVAKDIFSMAN
jgi:hypothetical protein